MKAVIYARVSTDEQAARGFSLPTQIEACRQYAAQKGYQVLEVFQDDYTGTVMDRPELNNLREFVLNHDVKIMIVYDIDRLARKAIYQMLIEEELDKQGVRIEYVLGQYEDTDEGRLQKQIRASIAEYEKAKFLERGKRGKFGKAKSGSVIVGARPPYGYKTNQEGNKKWFEIDEEEAKVVQLIFDLYVNGDGTNPPLSQNQIAVRLTELRIPTRGDKHSHVAKKYPKYTWRPATIRSILDQEAYTGTWYYGKTKMEKGKQIPRDRSEWISVPVPKIIDPELFLRAKTIRKHNLEMSPRNTKYKYLLRGRLKCAKCGYSYVGRTRSEKHQYYYCKGREQKPISLCDMPNFRADVVNEIILMWITEIVLDPENLAAGLRENNKSEEEINSRLHEQLRIIDDQIRDNQQKLERLIDLVIEGDFPREMVATRRQEIEKTIQELEIEKGRLVAELSDKTITEDQIIELEQFAETVSRGILVADFETKRRVIDLLDVRGKLAIESGEKVVYVTCKLEQQPRSLAQISPLPNNHNGTAVKLRGRLEIK